MERNRSSLAYILFIVLVIGLVFRLTPTTVFNEPYSTDVWPLIKISRKLLENPNLKIFDDRFFDGYNNRWPGVVLSTTVISIITDLDIFTVYRYLHPIIVITTFSILVYILLQTLCGNKKLCSIGLLYFLSVPSLIVFTSALLKEVYAYAFLYILLIYALRKWSSLRREVLLILIVSLALTITHYFVTLIAVGILGSTLIAYLIAKAMGHLGSFEKDHIISQIISILLIISLTFSTYYSLVGHTAFKIKFAIYDLLPYLFYSIFVFGSYTLYLRHGKGFIPKIIILSIVSSLLILAIALGVPMLSGLEIRSNVIPYYIVPVALPFILFINRESSRQYLLNYLLNGILLFMMINTLFIVFSRPEFSTIFHRIANYLVLANTLLIVSRLSITRRKTVKVIAPALSIVSLIFGGIVVMGVATGMDDLVYYWTYREPEIYGFNYALKYSTDEMILSGDAKASYYISIDRSVDESIVLKAQYTNYHIDNRSIVILYKDNYVWGYVVSLSVYKIDRFIDQLTSIYRIYDNSYVNILTGWED